MKPSFILAFILCVSSFSTTAMLFWDGTPKSKSKRTTPPTAIEIKWGEGS
jgi:hypothetical protein